MKRSFFLVPIFLLCTCLFANVFAQRSSDKVLGHGDITVSEENEADPVGNGSSLPTEDRSKWYVTLLTRKGCPHCEQLRRDFAEHPQLKVFVDTEDRHKSWAHWNVCSMDDPLQAWRFKAPHSNVKIQGYPTLLVQPPLNGKFGNGQTIVFQKTGYDGDASKLARQLRSSIERPRAGPSNGGSESLDSITRRRSRVTR